MRTTRWIRAGVVLVATTLAAGCGGAAGNGSAAPAAEPAPAVAPAPATDPLEQVVAASEATLAAGSARFTMSMDATGGGNAFTMLSASGGTDFGAQVTEMEMSLVPQPGAPAQTVRSVMVGGTIYQQPAGHERWFAVDTAALGQAQADPAEQIRQFRNAAKDVRDAGTTEIRGQAMRHYELTLTPTATPPGGVAQLPPGGVPADLYIDDQGRFARIETQTPTPNQTTTVLTMDLFDYGTPVSVQAPDPGLVDPMPR